MKLRDQILSLIILVLSALGYYKATELPAGGPDIFPKSICIGMFFLGFILFISTMLGFSKKEEKKEEANYLQVFSILAITVLYFILIPRIGYFISTPIFLVLTSYLLHCRKIKVILFYPLVLTLFLYLTFSVFLKVPFP